jgi:hypothetical protein
MRKAMADESPDAIDERLARLTLSIDAELRKRAESPRGCSFRKHMAREEQLRDAARHEAAHAVFCVIDELKLYHVLIRENGSGLCTSGSASRADLVSKIMLSLVGSVAAAIMQPKRSLRWSSLDGGSTDRAKVDALIARLGPEWKIRAGGATLIEYFEERCAEFVIKNRQAITAVADALYDKRKLSGDEVAAIVAAHR